MTSAEDLDPDFPPEEFIDTSSFLFELCALPGVSYEVGRVQECVSQLQADIYELDESGLTALHIAARAGNCAAASELLACAGPDGLRRLLSTPAPLHHGATPLHFAAAHSQPCLELLLERLQQDHGHEREATAALLDVLDDRNRSLLHYAAQSNNEGTLVFLLPLFSPRLGVDATDASGSSPLHLAAASNHLEAAGALLHAGAGLLRSPPRHWSPLHHAAMHDHAPMLRLLAEHVGRMTSGNRRYIRAELNAPDAASCRTPLHVAAEYGSAAAAAALLELGAAADCRDRGGETPLHLAAERGWTDVVHVLDAWELLQQHGRREGGGGSLPRQPTLLSYNHAGWTPAHLAAAANATDTLCALVSYAAMAMDSTAAAPVGGGGWRRMGGGGQGGVLHAPARAAGCEGWTPLHCAVAAGAVDAVQVLLRDLGADLHARDDVGRTPQDLLVDGEAAAEGGIGSGAAAVKLDEAAAAGMMEAFTRLSLQGNRSQEAAEGAGKDGRGEPLNADAERGARERAEAEAEGRMEAAAAALVHACAGLHQASFAIREHSPSSLPEYDDEHEDLVPRMHLLGLAEQQVPPPFSMALPPHKPGLTLAAIAASARAFMSLPSACAPAAAPGLARTSAQSLMKAVESFKALGAIALPAVADLPAQAPPPPPPAPAAAPAAGAPFSPFVLLQGAAAAGPSQSDVPTAPSRLTIASAFAAATHTAIAAGPASSLEAGAPPGSAQPLTKLPEAHESPSMLNFTSPFAGLGPGSASLQPVPGSEAGGLIPQQPPTHGSEAHPGRHPAGRGTHQQLSPMNSPWGDSPLNRAIVRGDRPEVVEQLVRTLPPRVASVRLEPLEIPGMGGGAQVAHQHHHPHHRAPHVAVLEHLTEETALLAMTGSTRTSAALTLAHSCAAFSGLSTTQSSSPRLSPLSPLSPFSAAGGPSLPCTPSVTTQPHLPAPVRVLLEEVEGASGAASLPLYRTTEQAGADQEGQAAWLALPGAAGPDPRVGWVCLDVEVQLQATEQPVDGLRPRQSSKSNMGPAPRLWLGVGCLGADWEGGDGTAGAGAAVLGRAVPAAALPPGLAAAVDVVAGQVAQAPGGAAGCGAGSASVVFAAARRELALGTGGGGRAGIVWDVHSGAMAAYVDGRFHGVIASGLPRPLASAAAAASPSSSAASPALAPLLGVHLPPGSRLRVRWGAPPCASPPPAPPAAPPAGPPAPAPAPCLDDMLLELEAYREGRWRELVLACEAGEGGGEEETAVVLPWSTKPSMTCLHFAAWAGNAAALQQLLAAGTLPPDVPDADGWTPAHFAAAAGRVGALEALLRAGAAADVCTHQRRTPSMLAAACRYPHPEGSGAAAACLDALATHGSVDLAVRDERGRSLLMLAAEAGNVEAVRWLLSKGADPRLADHAGRKTLQYGSHCNAVFTELEAALARPPSPFGAAAECMLGFGFGAGTGLPPQLSGRVTTGCDQQAAAVLDGGADGGGGAGSLVSFLPLGIKVVPADELAFEGRLGEGGFGEVVSATFRGLPVAVKRMRSSDRIRTRDRATLTRELEVFGRLHTCEHVVGFLGVVAIGAEEWGIVMPRYHTSLHHVFTEGGQRLNKKLRFRVAREIAEGLQFLHRSNVVHRDLKPDNVLLTKTWEVKLCDFGLSHVLSQQGAAIATEHGDGHAYWMAPEVLQNQQYDYKADVWSYGVVLYQLATWVDASVYESVHPLYLRHHWTDPSGNPSRLTDRMPPELPDPLAELLEACLHVDPRARPSMPQVLQALARVPDGELPEPASERETWRRRGGGGAGGGQG